jgi:hypothetical protein
MTVEDRYYTKAEYDKLTLARKLGLKRKREARNHKPGSKSSKVKNDKHKGSRGGMNLSKRSVKALATQLSKLQDDADTSDPDQAQTDDSDDGGPTKRARTNRTNPALAKPKTK